MAEDYVSAVNDVISVCRDAEEGFRSAAEAVKDAGLKRIFEQYSQQRATFAAQLQQALQGTGREADNPSGVGGKMHGAWIKLKGALTGHSEHQILAETERGEDYSVSTYRDALGKNLPPNLKTIVQEQFALVQQAHDKIRTLRDSTAHEPVGSR
ncbi:MAG TPA: PA2169 family four-helix-bundle protein [Bryobacteraceae bacterium]|nr:PA2169 family four-helix-bundle protein [Bryobacteraceae bacterium]